MVASQQQSATHADAAPNATGQDHHIPGELGLWFLIFADMIIFAYLFVAFLVERGQAPSEFQVSQSIVDANLGALNSLILLTSSFLVCVGVASVRSGLQRAAFRALGGATLLGVSFVVVKIVEYYRDYQQGGTGNSSTFFRFYYLLTGIHLVHVIVGIGILGVLSMRALSPSTTRGQKIFLEAGACYWHMVDLLWLLIFPLLYLIK